MGIKGLGKLIPKTAISTHLISALNGFKIAFDFSYYLHKFKAIENDSYPMRRTYTAMIGRFVRAGCIMVCVQDGIPPKEKEHTRNLRKDAKQKHNQKYISLTNAVSIISSLKNSDNITKYDLEDVQRNLIEGGWDENILIESVRDIPLIDDILEKAKKHMSQTFSFDDSEIKAVLADFKRMGVVVCTAPQEGEHFCAALCSENIVDLCMTDDYDAFVCMAPAIARNYSGKTGSIDVVVMSKVLEDMDLTPTAFMGLCVLCGTDYGGNIPKVGCKKAIEIINAYGDLDDIPDTVRLPRIKIDDFHEKLASLTTPYQRQFQIFMTRYSEACLEVKDLIENRPDPETSHIPDAVVAAPARRRLGVRKPTVVE